MSAVSKSVMPGVERRVDDVLGLLGVDAGAEGVAAEADDETIRPLAPRGR